MELLEFVVVDGVNRLDHGVIEAELLRLKHKVSGQHASHQLLLHVHDVEQLDEEEFIDLGGIVKLFEGRTFSDGGK